MKRIATVLLAATLLLGCAKTDAPAADQQPDKLTIYATLFPQYDFARTIAGDRAEVKLLLPPGVESHSYEPTPADIVGLTKSDMLLYTGDEMEPWVVQLLDGELPESVEVVDLSKGISMLKEAEHEHETQDVHEHDEHDEHDEHEHDAHTHSHVFDPHIWTSPKNAMTMVQTVTDALCARDPEGEDMYRSNATAYLAELESLDEEITGIVQGAKRHELIFGGRFALSYFTETYGLTAYSAYDSCSEETEPSAKAVAEVIDRVRNDQIPIIYYEEMTDPKVARSIADETGAKLLLMHTCHNLSKDEMAAGETYLSLMHQNAKNLSEGLNG